MSIEDFCFVMRRIDWEDVANAPSVVHGYLSPVGVQADNDGARRNLANAIMAAQKAGVSVRVSESGEGLS